MNAAVPTRRGVVGDRWCAAGVFLFALLLRWLYCGELAQWFVFSHPLVDAQHYQNLAIALLQDGDAALPALAWQPAWVAVVLSWAYRAFGVGPIGPIMNALVGAVNCLLIYQISRALYGRRAGVAAGLAGALYGPLIFFDCAILNEPWSNLWMLLGFTCIAPMASDETPLPLQLGRGVLLGVLGSLMLLTRPLAVLIWAMQCLWYALGRVPCSRPDRSPLTAARTEPSVGPQGAGGSLWRMAGRLGVVAVSLVLCHLAASLLLAEKAGGFFWLAQSGGINAYIGTHPDHVATVGIRPGHAWDLLIHGEPIDDVDGYIRQNREFLNRAADNLLANKRAYARNLVRKTALFLSPTEVPRNESIYVYRDYSFVLRCVVLRIGRFGLPFALLAVLLLHATAFNWRRSGWLLLTVCPYVLATIAAFHVNSRYRIQIIPVLLIAVSPSVTACWDGALRRVNWRTVARLSAAALAYGMVCLLGGSDTDLLEPDLLRGEHHRFLAVRRLGNGQTAEARVEAEQALELNPDDYQSHNVLGHLDALEGHYQRAEARYLRAIEMRADYYPAYFNLARRHEKLNQPVRAIEMYEKGLRYAPYDRRAEGRLVAIHRTIGSPEKSGDIYMFLRSYGNALEYYELALASRDLTSTPSLLNNAAWAALQTAEDRDALQIALARAEQAVKLSGGSNIDFVDTLAEALMRCGRLEPALEQFSRAHALALLSEDDRAVRGLSERMARCRTLIRSRSGGE